MNMNRAGLSDKDRNQLQVLNALIGSREISAIDERTGKNKLSPATVSRIFKKPAEKDLIRYIGKEKSRKGQEPELFCFNGEYGYLLHSTTLRLWWFMGISRTQRNSPRAVQCEVRSAGNTRAAACDTRKHQKRAAPGQEPEKQREFWRRAFAVPGVINKNQRTIHTIPDVCMLSDTKLIDYAERILGVPVIANNVSWLSAVGEKAGRFIRLWKILYTSC